MPNWCRNTMTVSHQYHDKILNNKNEVDFNIILPMPESLNIDSGSMNNSDMYMYLSKKNTVSYSEVRLNADVNIILKNKNIFRTAEKELECCLSEVRSLISSGSEEEINKSYKSGRTLVENYKNYGYLTWYEWCNSVWGTKWNALNTDVANDDVITFDTAWGPPVGWLEKLISLGVPFEFSWEEEGGLYGKYVSDGKTLEETESGVVNDDED